MSREKAAALIERARQANRRRSAADRKTGFAVPVDGASDELLRTVILALLAGLEATDWTCVAEAYVLAGDLHRMTTGKEYAPEPRP